VKKRIYRAVVVNKVNLDKLSELVRGESVVFGVDVAKEDFFGALMDERQQVLQTIKWKSPHQVRELVEFLTQLPASSLEVAMEPSGTYGDALRAVLQQTGIPVFRVSPKRCHDAAEVYDGVPSMHDAKAAAIIAKLHWDGASSEWTARSEHERSLVAAVETMTMYDSQYQRWLNRLEARLARHWPELTQILELDSASLLELLSEFGGPDQVAARTDEARCLLKRVGRSLLAEDKRERVIETACHTIGVALIEAERQALSGLAREALRNRKAARNAKAEVERLSGQDAATRCIAGVTGKVTAAVLQVTVGDANHFTSASAYQKGIGLNLKERSSGKHKGQLKITKRGPGRARRYLYMFTLRMIKDDAVCRAWYARKVTRDGGKKIKAIIALMRKLAAALWHVARGQRFDATRLFDVRRLKLAAT